MKLPKVDPEHRQLALALAGLARDGDERRAKWVETGEEQPGVCAPGSPVDKMATALAQAEAKGAARADAELLKHRDLVEALQFLPAGTVVDFCDLDDFLHEMRESGWRPRRECSDHKFLGSRSCARCGVDVDELQAPANGS